MPSEKLAHKRCENAKAGHGERLELWDTEVRGLCLRVSAEAKVWVYRYRRPDGSMPRLKMGSYTSGPVDITDKDGEVKALTLAGARSRARKLKVLIDDGGDPAGDKARTRTAAKSEPLKTFKDLSDAYIKASKDGTWKPRRKKRRPRTIADDEAVMRRYVEPELGAKRIEEITQSRIERLLADMVKRGIGAQTNRTHAFIRQAFAYALKKGRVSINPAAGIELLAEIKRRQRVLTDAELRALWRGLAAPSALKITHEDGTGEQVHVSRPMAIIIQLCAILLQRKSEIAGMRASELALDQRVWLVPGERMKGGRDHLVPLPPHAVELIEEALRLRSNSNSPCVFPSSRDPDVPVRGDSVTHAMRKVCAALDIEGAAVHDLRRTGSTALTSERLGVSQFVRSLVLSHRGDTGGGAAVSIQHYDANEYVSEKRKALAAWESLVLKIVSSAG